MAIAFYGRSLRSVTIKRLVTLAHYILITISLSATRLVLNGHMTLILRPRNIINTKIACCSTTTMPRLWGNKWNGDERKGRGKSRVGSTFRCWSFIDALTDRRCSTYQQATRSSFKCLRLSISHSTYSGRLTGRAQEEATII